MTTPKIDNIYAGFISNIDHLGFHIHLSEFQKKFEGLLYKSCVDKNLSDKLICGRCVKVKVTAYNENSLAINLVSIEEEFNEEMGDIVVSKGIQGRKFRTASPLRFQDKKFNPGNDIESVNILMKEEPDYYKNRNLKLNTGNLNLGSSSWEVPLNSRVRLLNTFMYKNGMRFSSQKFPDYGLVQRLSYTSGWNTGKTLRSTNLSQSGPSPAKLTHLWSSDKSGKSLKEQRESLPIFKYKDDLIRELAKNQFVIVQGETGSGNNTFKLTFHFKLEIF